MHQHPHSGPSPERRGEGVVDLSRKPGRRGKNVSRRKPLARPGKPFCAPPPLPGGPIRDCGSMPQVLVRQRFCPAVRPFWPINDKKTRRRCANPLPSVQNRMGERMCHAPPSHQRLAERIVGDRVDRAFQGIFGRRAGNLLVHGRTTRRLDSTLITRTVCPASMTMPSLMASSV